MFAQAYKIPPSILRAQWTDCIPDTRVLFGSHPLTLHQFDLNSKHVACFHFKAVFLSQLDFYDTSPVRDLSLRNNSTKHEIHTAEPESDSGFSASTMLDVPLGVFTKDELP